MFDGIRKYGSLEQRVMGSFIMYDHSEDHKIQREEVVTMMRTATAVAGAQLTDAMIQQALETLMAIADTDHVCDSLFSSSFSFFIAIPLFINTTTERHFGAARDHVCCTRQPRCRQDLQLGLKMAHTTSVQPMHNISSIVHRSFLFSSSSSSSTTTRSCVSPFSFCCVFSFIF